MFTPLYLKHISLLYNSFMFYYYIAILCFAYLDNYFTVTGFLYNSMYFIHTLKKILFWEVIHRLRQNAEGIN